MVRRGAKSCLFQHIDITAQQLGDELFGVFNKDHRSSVRLYHQRNVDWLPVSGSVQRPFCDHEWTKAQWAFLRTGSVAVRAKTGTSTGATVACNRLMAGVKGQSVPAYRWVFAHRANVYDGVRSLSLKVTLTLRYRLRFIGVACIKFGCA